MEAYLLSPAPLLLGGLQDGHRSEQTMTEGLIVVSCLITQAYLRHTVTEVCMLDSIFESMGLLNLSFSH
jgi:hypothetical protein